MHIQSMEHHKIDHNKLTIPGLSNLIGGCIDSIAPKNFSQVLRPRHYLLGAAYGEVIVLHRHGCLGAREGICLYDDFLALRLCGPSPFDQALPGALSKSPLKVAGAHLRIIHRSNAW